MKCGTSNFVIDELATLLYRRTNPSFAEERILNIYNSINFTIFRPEPNIELEALILMKKYSDKMISFTDCISFTLMKHNNIKTAFSFDKHFKFAGLTLLQ